MAATADLRAVKRYAGALFNTANAASNLDATLDGLNQVNQAFDSSPELQSMLQNPRLTHQRKEDLLKKIFQGQLPQAVIHLLFVMIEKDRATQIPFVAGEFKRLIDEHRKQADASVTSAVPLSEAQVVKLKSELKTISGYDVRLTQQVDPNILGGLIVRVGDRMIDSSVANQLNLVQERLKQVKVI